MSPSTATKPLLASSNIGHARTSSSTFPELRMPESVHLQNLLSHRLRALNGRGVGRSEEGLAETEGGVCYVTEYLLGANALFHRLAVVRFAHAILGLFGLTRSKSGYRVRWDQLNLGDPSKPRLRCKVEELSPVDQSSNRSKRKKNNTS